MHESANMPSKAWVYLLWSQYNKLSEPLKEGFINLAQSMAKEAKGQNVDAEAHEMHGNGKSAQKEAEIANFFQKNQ